MTGVACGRPARRIDRPCPFTVPTERAVNQPLESKLLVGQLLQSYTYRCIGCCNWDPWIREYQYRPLGVAGWGRGVETAAGSIKSSQNCTLALTADFHVPKSKTRSQCTTKVGFAAFARHD